ncbi:MAG: DUF721 domain-containing protein [Candidatus Dependentiae bacterium]|nr:DUF721 domain-containing protein [Candidatus Dependentiae bacterium]
MAHHIKQLLSSILPKTTDWKRLLLENWPTIIGKLHSRVTVEHIHDDSLVLGVQDSCWLQELYMLSPMLIKQINEKLDLPHIKQIRFKQIGRIIQKNSSSGLIKSTKSQCVVHLSAIEQEALGRVADPELKKVLASYLIRCYQEKE